MNYKFYNLLCIKLFVLSPIFLFILSVFVCIICGSIDSVILCEEETLNDLKNLLIEDSLKFNKIINEYQEYDDLRGEAINRSVKDPDLITSLSYKASTTMKEAINILAKVRQTECSIKEMHAPFVSNIKEQWFERVLSKLDKEPFKRIF